MNLIKVLWFLCTYNCFSIKLRIY